MRGVRPSHLVPDECDARAVRGVRYGELERALGVSRVGAVRRTGDDGDDDSGWVHAKCVERGYGVLAVFWV